MSDVSASERRLGAALDRIGKALEAGAAASLPASTDDRSALIDRLQSQNMRLADELAALRTDRGDAPDAQLAEMRARLSTAGEQAARLAAANDELAAANRVLIDAAAGPDADATDAALNALVAEVEALRAARTAEMAQMGDIMAELDRLLALDGSEGQGNRPAPRTTPEAGGDETGLPDTADSPQQRSI